MAEVILIRQPGAVPSVDEALSSVIGTVVAARVKDRVGDMLLIETDPRNVAALRRNLPGWVVSPQAGETPAPDFLPGPPAGKG